MKKYVPEEIPSMPVKTRIFQIEPPKQRSGFENSTSGRDCGMNELMLERIQSSAKALKIDLYTDELAIYADEKELAPEVL